MDITLSMRFSGNILAAICLGFLGLNAAATTYYVDINSTNPTSPYTNWATASTDIQSAINQTTNGDLVLVNPGVYESGGYIAQDGSTNTVIISNTITLQSVDGASTTIINGSNAMRCVYMTNSAMLEGFTLTNGYAANGGGVWCASLNESVADCLLFGNTATNDGGGAYLGTLTNCLVCNNFATSEAGVGGGAFNSTLNNCMISGNSSYDAGGCYAGTLNNCLVISNSALVAGATFNCILNNCTVVKNSTTSSLYTESAVEIGTAYNSIIYNNSPYNYYSILGSGTFTNCCTTPLPSGPNNLTNNPLFVNPSGNDFQLQSNSLCINAGNNAYAVGNVDLAGNPRIVDGNVDIGAYEYQGHVPLTLGIQASGTNVVAGYALFFNALFFNGFPTNLVWDFGDGIVISNQTYVSHIWSALGNYTVTLTAFNPYNPGGATATLAVNVLTQTTRYVSLNSSNPMPPYTNWTTAAIDIQSAVNAANPGDLVLVTNGAPPFQANNIAIYQLNGGNALSYSNRVAASEPITIQSVNGPAWTCIEGSRQCRAVYLTNGATLSGFTISNGWAGGEYNYGGGIYAQSTNVVITNCIITGCNAQYGAGVYSGTLYNSIIQSNSGSIYGQGTYMSALYNCALINNSGGQNGAAANSILNNCVLSNNASSTGGAAYECILTNCALIKNSGANGAGAYGSSLYNCLLASNTATEYGGGCYGGALYNCLLISNTAALDGGAAYGQGNIPIVLNNCLICSNKAEDGGGAYGPSPEYCLLTNCTLIFNSAKLFGGAAYFSELNNCFIASNSAIQQGGGAYQALLYNCTVVANSAPLGGGAFVSTIYNSIIFNNFSTANNSQSNYDNSILKYCCTLPAASGIGNITNDPDFVNPAANNFQLQANSPCINAGNNAYVATTTDLAGNPRIQGGTVDIGAYEYQTPTSVISYAWLQQYGLPTDGSVDFTNLDGTAFNVYQDWVAGLNPTNSASVLVMLSPSATNNTAGITVSWQSVSGILYNLQCSTNLPAFSTIQTNLTGQTGTTSYTDTTATNNWPYFFRVSVQAP